MARGWKFRIKIEEGLHYPCSETRRCHFRYCCHMSRDVRKPVLGVSEQVRNKRGCTATVDGWRLEILDLDRRGIALSMSQNKALISFAVTPKLICVFVFAYANGWRLEISDLDRRGIALSMSQNKALISFAVTPKLICVFVFPYAKIRVSHVAAHMWVKQPSC